MSTEAEVRDILESVVKPPAHLKIGQALSALGRQAGLTNQDFDDLSEARDRTPAEARIVERSSSTRTSFPWR